MTSKVLKTLWPSNSSSEHVPKGTRSRDLDGPLCSPVYSSAAHNRPEEEASRVTTPTGWNTTQPQKGRNSAPGHSVDEPWQRSAQWTKPQKTNPWWSHLHKIPRVIGFVETGGRMWVWGSGRRAWAAVVYWGHFEFCKTKNIPRWTAVIPITRVN